MKKRHVALGMSMAMLVSACSGIVVSAEEEEITLHLYGTANFVECRRRWSNGSGHRC